jgi:hypothetical protein
LYRGRRSRERPGKFFDFFPSRIYCEIFPEIFSGGLDVGRIVCGNRFNRCSPEFSIGISCSPVCMKILVSGISPGAQLEFIVGEGFITAKESCKFWRWTPSFSQTRSEGWSHPEIPRRNSGTTEPAAAPVVPLFPQPPDIRGHNSQKRGTGPE